MAGWTDQPLAMDPKPKAPPGASSKSKTHPPKASGVEASNEGKPGKPELKGLILRPDHAGKFFRTEIPGVTKTLELRSVRCRCLGLGDRFYIVCCQQGKNKSGVSVMKVLGSVAFQGVEQIPFDDIPNRYNEHFCPADVFQKLSSKWSNCFGWKVSDALAFKAPKWIPTKGQDWGVVSAFDGFCIVCCFWCLLCCSTYFSAFNATFTLWVFCISCHFHFVTMTYDCNDIIWQHCRDLPPITQPTSSSS